MPRIKDSDTMTMPIHKSYFKAPKKPERIHITMDDFVREWKTFSQSGCKKMRGKFEHDRHVWTIGLLVQEPNMYDSNLIAAQRRHFDKENDKWIDMKQNFPVDDLLWM